MRYRLQYLLVFALIVISGCKSSIIIPKKYGDLVKGYLINTNMNITNVNESSLQNGNVLYFIDRDDFILYSSEIGPPFFKMKEVSEEPIFVIKIDNIANRQRNKPISFTELFPDINKNKIIVYEEDASGKQPKRIEILSGHFLIKYKDENHPYRADFDPYLKTEIRRRMLGCNNDTILFDLHSSRTFKFKVQIATGFELHGIVPSHHYY